MINSIFLNKSPLVVALACLFGAQLLSEPLKELTKGGSTILEGVGLLINVTTVFSFEVFRDNKAELRLIYRGVQFDSMVSKAGSWCADEVCR